MKDRCPHGLLTGSRMCPIAWCDEFDGYSGKSGDSIRFGSAPVRKALTWCRCGVGFKPDGHELCPECRLCGNCETRPRAPKHTYCKVCLKRFAENRACHDCGAAIVCKDRSSHGIGKHVRILYCRRCALRRGHVVITADNGGLSA